MESTNLTPLPPDDEFERFLSDRLSRPLPDDGFTQRVLAALPPPRPPRLVSRRAILLTIGTIAGCFAAWRQGALGPGRAEWQDFTAALSTRLVAQSADLAATVATSQWTVLLSCAAVAAALFLAIRPPSAGESNL